MKNIDRYNAMLAEIDAHEHGLFRAFMAGKTVPPSIYAHGGNSGVKEWKVEHVKLTPCAWPEKKPTNKDIERLQSIRGKAIAATEVDPLRVIIHLSMPNITTGVPWIRVDDRSYGYFWTREEAEAANNLWHEEHDPRPDHFACAYCSKQTPNSRKVTRTIFVNRGQQVRDFCSGQCASYDQFASEG